MDVKEIFQLVALGVGALTGLVTTIKNISDMAEKRKRASNDKRSAKRKSKKGSKR